MQLPGWQTLGLGGCRLLFPHPDLMTADDSGTPADLTDSGGANNPALATVAVPLWVKIGLALSLCLLAAHAGYYWFLTDDAYISFRYARNLARGAGLVFNPGGEPVEGYTNFLWVVLLAGVARLGPAPEAVANVLSLLASIGLCGLIIFYCLRDRPRRGLEWLLL